MQGEIETRAMAANDLVVARALWRRTAGVELSEGDDPASLATYLARNPGLSRVALSAGRIVGAVLCGHDGRRGLIYHLAVDVACRGQGVGRRLVRECLDDLRAAGIQRALILVARDNPGGRSFWASLDFEKLSNADVLGIDL